MMNSIERAHVLIVDDDILLRTMAAQTLLHAGFDVSEAASGEAGLARMGERRFDLIPLRSPADISIALARSASTVAIPFS